MVQIKIENDPIDRERHERYYFENGFIVVEIRANNVLLSVQIFERECLHTRTRDKRTENV